MGRIVDLPLLYNATGVPARARNVQSVGILDIVPVEIPEVASADLPVALRADGRPLVHVHEGRFLPVGTMFVQDVEQFEAAIAGFERGKAGNYFSRALATPMQHVFGLGISSGRVTALHSRLDSDMRSIETSTEEADRAAFMRDVVPRLLIVDGSLQVLEEEPCWNVETSRAMPRQISPHAHVRFQESWDRSGFSWAFRMDGLERAVEFAGRIGRQVHPPEFEIEDTGIVEWKLDEVRLSAETLGRWIDAQIGGGVAPVLLKKAPVEFFSALVTLREWRKHSHAETVAAAGVVLDGLADLDAAVLGCEGLVAALRNHIAVDAMQPQSPELAVLGELKI